MALNKVDLCGVDTSKLPVLTSAEMKKLFERIAAGDETAREEFVGGNLRLVLSVVQRFAGRGEMMDDLFQVGCIGLMKSIDNFDTTLGVRFSTYAVPMIIGEIFAANLGGAATMTGDPPNIILGTSLGLGFWDFLQNNGPICLVGFGVALGYFYLCFRNKLRAGAWSVDPALWAMEPGDAIPNRRAFGVNVAIFGGMILLLATHAWTGLTMPTIGVVAAAVTLAGNRRGWSLLRQVDWRTIGFIIGLFLVVSGLEQTGILDGLARFLGNLGGEDTGRMMVVLIWFTALLSAFVDNIPMATVMVPVLTALSDGLGMDLETLTWSVSKGTDIGGIATPIGASANVTGVMLAAREGHPISWRRYCKYAVPLSLLVLVLSMVLLLAFH